MTNKQLVQDLINRTNTGELQWKPSRFSSHFWEADGYTFYRGSSGQMSLEWATHQGPYGEHRIYRSGWFRGMLDRLGDAINQQFQPEPEATS